MRFPQTNKPPLGSLINWAHPLAKGLVGCWLMNEGSGNRISDLSGNGNNGTLIGANGLPTWVPGRSGPALSFDAVDDYAIVPHSSSLNLGNTVTFASWIYPTSFTGYRTVVAKAYSVFWFGLDGGSGRIQLWVGNVANQSDGAVQLNKWSYIAATWNGTTINYYINGLYDSFDSNANSATTNLLNMYIGADREGVTDPTYFFPGLIDIVHIYNRALLAQEIWQLYAFPYAMFERRPYWMNYVAAGGLVIPVSKHVRSLSPNFHVY